MYNKKPLNPTQKQVIGQIGEDCACQYLKKLGWKIVDRNYSRKWGEIDIVATSSPTNSIIRSIIDIFMVKNNKILHFIEVKSVSGEIPHSQNREVTRGTNNDSYRPEDNMHPWKLKRLSRVIQSYLLEKDARPNDCSAGRVSDETDWQFDVVTVYVDIEKRMSRVFLLEDIVL